MFHMASYLLTYFVQQQLFFTVFYDHKVTEWVLAVTYYTQLYCFTLFLSAVLYFQVTNVFLLTMQLRVSLLFHTEHTLTSDCSNKVKSLIFFIASQCHRKTILSEWFKKSLREPEMVLLWHGCAWHLFQGLYSTTML